MHKRSNTTTIAMTTTLLIGVLLAVGGCAKAKIEHTRRHVQGEALPRPPVLLIYDFAVNADDVVVDTFGPKFLTGSGKMSDRVKEGRKVQQELSLALVEKLRKKGIQAQRAYSRDRPPCMRSWPKDNFCP